MQESLVIEFCVRQLPVVYSFLVCFLRGPAVSTPRRLLAIHMQAVLRHSGCVLCSNVRSVMYTYRSLSCFDSVASYLICLAAHVSSVVLLSQPPGVATIIMMTIPADNAGPATCLTQMQP